MISNEYDVNSPDAADPNNDIGPVYGTFTGVPTLFTHILTRIKVRFYQDATISVDYYDSQTIRILSVKFKDVYTSGTFKATPVLTSNPDPTHDPYGTYYAPTIGASSWTSLGGVSDAVLFDSLVGTDAISTSSGAPTVVVEDYFALPQALVASGQKLEVKYRITSTKDDYIFSEEATDEAYLNSTPDWTPNTDITLTVKLSAIRTIPIEFTATAANWTDGQSYHLTPED